MDDPHIVARDPDHGLVLLGGLGVLQVGQMVDKEELKHQQYEGYAQAPLRDLRPLVVTP